MGDLSIQSHYSTRAISSNDIFPQSLHYEKVIEPELLWRCCLAPPFATPLYIQVVHRLQLWPGQSFRPIQCHCSSSNLQPPTKFSTVSPPPTPLTRTLGNKRAQTCPPPHSSCRSISCESLDKSLTLSESPFFSSAKSGQLPGGLSR